MPTLVSVSKTCRRTARRTVCLAVLLALTAARGAGAQQPQPPSWQDARCVRQSHAQAVFVGRVKGFEEVTLPINWGLGGGQETLRLVRFAVEERFKGAEQSEVGVLTRPAPNPRCPGDFLTGERYLVYAFSWHRQPELRTDFCHGAAPLAQAGDDLAYLRGLARGEPLAEIAGKVEQYRLDIKTWSLGLVRAVGGVPVTAEGAGRRVETRTDDAGRYHFAGLPVGYYVIHVAPPPGLYTTATRGAADLTRAACRESDFMLEADGRVGGRVTDTSGRPLEGVGVQLVLADSFPLDDTNVGAEALRGRSAVTDADGRYEFRGVPAGRYLLGVNLGDHTDAPLEWGERVRFPRTYYPGTTERARAAAVELREGASSFGHDLTVKPLPALTRRAITGTVALSDGRPALCAMVGIVDAKHAKTGRAITLMRVGEGGRFTLHAFEGYSYAVQAEVPVIEPARKVGGLVIKPPANVGYIAAEPFVVGPAGASEPVRLVIPPAGNCDFPTRPSP